MLKTKATRTLKKNSSGSAFFRQDNTGSVQRISYSSPLGTVPVTKPVIQRAINNQLLAGYSKRKDHAGEIARMINAYNQDIRLKNRQERINELFPIQTEVYKWFDNNRQQNLDENPDAVKMKKLLNDLQREHESLVRQSVINDDETPPVAGFDKLPEKIQTKVLNLWNDLLNDSGNIRISEELPYDDGKKTEHQDGFRYTALAAFARMLQTEFGRELLFRANTDTNGKKLITIRPGISENRGEIEKEDFEAKPLDANNGELQEVDTVKLFGDKKKGSNSYKKAEKFLKRFPELQFSKNSTADERIQQIHNAPKTFAGHSGYKIKIEGVFHYFTFNTGSASEIVLTPDTFDSSKYPTSRFVDSEGNEIIVPAFVTLTHELGHAVHMMEGNAVGRVSGKLGKAVAPGEDFGNWSQLEEYNTINGVENKIRDESGLTRRFGHGNFYKSFFSQLKNGPLNQLYQSATGLSNEKELFNEIGFAEIEINKALFEKHNTKLAKKELQKIISLVDQLIKSEKEKQKEKKQPVPQIPVKHPARSILYFMKIFPFG